MAVLRHERRRVVTRGKVQDQSSELRTLRYIKGRERMLRVALDNQRTLVAALEEIDTKMIPEATDDGTIRFYNVPCGPWHHVLGLIRGGLPDPLDK
jgi:hypothetical protein